MANRATSIARSLTAAVVSCALFATTIPAEADSLTIENLFVNYSTQTLNTATGTLDFDVVFADPFANPGNYNLFSIQILLNKLLGSTADFTLDWVETENTTAIGVDYWIPGPPTGNELASTQIGPQYRFEDFGFFFDQYNPVQDDVVAHYVFSFDADASDEFGDYSIDPGNALFNHFGSGFGVTHPTTIAPGAFEIRGIPEPTTLMLLSFGALLLSRRRRAAR